jgi:hypothetical protein
MYLFLDAYLCTRTFTRYSFLVKSSVKAGVFLTL